MTDAEDGIQTSDEQAFLYSSAKSMDRAWEGPFSGYEDGLRVTEGIWVL